MGTDSSFFGSHSFSKASILEFHSQIPRSEVGEFSLPGISFLPKLHFYSFYSLVLGFFEAMSQNILVTGGAGYIGSHTVLQLLLSGYRAVVVDNLDNSSSVAISRVKELAGEHASNLDFHKVLLLLIFFFYKCVSCMKSGSD